MRITCIRNRVRARPRGVGRDSTSIAIEEIGDDPTLGALDRRIQRLVGRIVLLRFAKRVERVLVQPERLLRAPEAAPRLGIGEIEIGPRSTKLGRAPRIARAQHPWTVDAKSLNARAPRRHD